jgi:hypothetical protein
MKHFWVLSYLDVNDKLHQERFDDGEEAREAWHIAYRPLFLDEVYRHEERI